GWPLASRTVTVTVAKVRLPAATGSGAASTLDVPGSGTPATNRTSTFGNSPPLATSFATYPTVSTSASDTRNAALPSASVTSFTARITEWPPSARSDTVRPGSPWPYRSFSVTTISASDVPSARTVFGAASTVDADASKSLRTMRNVSRSRANFAPPSSTTSASAVWLPTAFTVVTVTAVFPS